MGRLRVPAAVEHGGSGKGGGDHKVVLQRKFPLHLLTTEPQSSSYFIERTIQNIHNIASKESDIWTKTTGNVLGATGSQRESMTLYQIIV
jgi:hypothetical protein